MAPLPLLSLYSLVLAYLALLLLPGVAVACWLHRRYKLDDLVFGLIVTGTTPLLGYLSFWLFLESKLAGRIFCYAVFAGSLSVLLALGRRKSFWTSLSSAVSVPITLLAASCFLYLSLLWVSGTAGLGAKLAHHRFFEQERPQDNLIPLFLADKIHSRLPLKPFCCGDWLSSDRPPLQAGVMLLFRPIRLVPKDDLDYQVVGSVLQCLWIFGAWFLLRACGLSSILSRQVIGLLIFSAFFFYNSVYVWPKLLAATFVLLAAAVLVRSLRRQLPVSTFAGYLAGISVALALLAHPGSVFSLPAFIVAALWNFRLLRVRSIVAALAPCALLLASWSAYQRWIDPPGNRLTKMHLAAVFDVDNRTLPQAISDAYRKRTFAEIVSNKVSNLTNLFGTDPRMTHLLDRSEQARVTQREYIWSALWLLEAGWGVALFWLVTKRRRMPELKPFAWLLSAAVFNLVVWSLILFGPHGTYTTHSSYADILLLGLSLATFILVVAPRTIALLLASFEIYNLYGTWGLPHPKILADAPLSTSMLTGAIAITVFLLWFGFFHSPKKNTLLPGVKRDFLEQDDWPPLTGELIRSAR